MRACDIGFSEDARAACASHWDAASSSTFSGFMHASGVLQDALLGNQTVAGIKAVFAAKVSGAQNLLRALGPLNLAFTTLFSSVAGLLGSAGQGNYAAANAVLDSLAAQSTLQVQSCLAWS